MTSDDGEDSESIIRRLKLLSKSQTAFIKKYAHDKIKDGVALVSNCIDILDRKLDANTLAAKLKELKKDLIALKLDRLVVDVNGIRTEMQNELEILRKSTSTNADLKAILSSEITKMSSTAASDRVTSLESENKHLKELLKEAKAALSRKQGNTDSVMPPPPPGDKDASRVHILEADVAALTAELIETKKTAEERLAAKVKELTAAAGKRAKEEADKFEAEKEEMMDAMAQEVEEIEKTKDKERDAILAEKKRVEDKLAASTRLTKSVSTRVGGVSVKAKSLASSRKAFATDVKRELDNMRVFLKDHVSGSLLAKLQSYGESVSLLSQRYRRELSERKRLHNVVQELKGNIRVFLRCRPPSSKEYEQYGPDSSCISFPSSQEVHVVTERNKEKTWEFDEVFGYDSTQEQVYLEVSALVASMMDGYNVCIFAYGQTGSGKTFTMSGPQDNRGVNTRALGELFEKTTARRDEYHDTITVSILEVYNEDIRDLLVEGGGADKLEVRQSEQGNYVPGLTTVAVSDLRNVFELLAVADRNRASASTNLNEHSSRSHMMLTVTLVSESITTGVVVRGKLNLVDLAGSERVNKSGAMGQAMKEAQNINKSLSALGDVIAARVNKNAHIPFRNSTLTYLLQDSLSQDSKTLMIVCASPILASAEETFCSLNFASRVRTVELGKATKNISSGVGGGKVAVPGGKPGVGAKPALR